MLAASNTNLNQGERELAIFEEGRVFNLGKEGADEHERIGVVLSVAGGGDEELFARLKGVVDDLIRRVGLPAVSWKVGGGPWMAAGAGAELVSADGTVVGVAGLLSQELMKASDLRHQVAVAELNLDVAEEPKLPRFEALARHPSVIVDTTVEHGAELSFAELERVARDMTDDLVEDVSFVTQFRPKGEPQVVRTTLRFVYRHPDRSLTQEEVNTAHEELRQGLAKKLGVGFA